MGDPLSWRSTYSEEVRQEVPNHDPEFIEFDFSRSNEQVLPATPAASKTFLIRKEGDVADRTITIHNNEKGNSFAKMCQIFKVCMDKYNLQYTLRLADGKARIITITNDDFVGEQCGAFYNTCKEYSLLTLKKKENEPSNARLMRPGERLYKTVMTKTFTVDERFYELLGESPQLCEQYLEKQKFVSLLIGRDCSNLLNHGFFKCHINGCYQLIKLNAFCNLSQIFKHFKKHSSKGNTCAKTLLRRYSYLTRETSHNWRKIQDLDIELEELSNKFVEGHSLTVDVRGKFYVDKGMKFNGAHLMLDIGIVKKLALNDLSVLRSPEIPSTSNRVQSFYGKKAASTFFKKKSSKSSNEVTFVEEVPGSSVITQVDSDEDNDNDVDENLSVHNIKKRKLNELTSSSDESE